MTEFRPDFAVPVPTMDPQVRSGPGKTEDRTIRFDPRNVWRVGFVVIALAAVALLLRFVIADGGNAIFTVLMAWFASIVDLFVGRFRISMGILLAVAALYMLWQTVRESVRTR